MFALILTLHLSLSTSTFFGRSQAIPHRSANQNTIHMYISFECVWVQAFNAYFMLSILWKSEGKKMQVKRITFHNSQEEWEGKHWDSKESDIQSVSAGERKRERKSGRARANFHPKFNASAFQVWIWKQRLAEKVHQSHMPRQNVSINTLESHARNGARVNNATILPSFSISHFEKSPVQIFMLTPSESTVFECVSRSLTTSSVQVKK